jgi:hypothetical protein
VPYGVGPIEGSARQPVSALEPGSSSRTTATAVAGGEQGAGGAVPETSGSDSSAEPRAVRKPSFEYAPGEEPRPREGEPTGWSHGELL